MLQRLSALKSYALGKPGMRTKDDDKRQNGTAHFHSLAKLSHPPPAAPRRMQIPALAMTNL
jgi:hypothetical protein